MLFSQRKSPICRQFPALLLHLHHPPALLSLPQLPCAGQKVTLSSAAPGAIYSHSGRSRSSYYTKELLISNSTPYTSPSRVLSDLTAPGSTREGAGLAGERQQRQEEGWRTRMASPREGFSPLHLAIFHTPPARGFCRALPEFTSPKLFVLFPATNVSSWQGPRSNHPWCGEFGKGVSLGSNTLCCISSRGGQSPVHREI